jgi:DNA-binding MarR family transcriptional regulator
LSTFSSCKLSIVTKEADAAAAWGSLLQLFLGVQPARFQGIAVRERITERVIRALLHLSPDEPKTMRELAGDWVCDASNVTGIVDALEERGFAVREPHPDDRRVKLVRLTPAGAAARERMVGELAQPSPALLALSAEDLRHLRQILGRLPGGTV